MTLDIFDHGPLLFVICGQFAPVDDLKMRIERDNMSLKYDTNTDRTQILVSATVPEPIRVNVQKRPQTVHLYNEKHCVTFEQTIISEFTLSDDVTEIEFASEDYTILTDWQEQYA